MPEGGKATDLSAMAQRWTRPAPLNEPGLFGPGQAILPVNPEESPRLFEYQAGVNLVSIPRVGFGLASFKALRNLAAACKEIRLNIELIKREIRALEWAIVPAQDNTTPAGIDQVKDQLDTPDGYHDFDSWLNMLLEEMLVTDAVTVWPEGDGLELVDGTTIRPLLDFRGRVPAPPNPAYIQILHGVPVSYFSRDKLLYAPFNTDVYSPYGTSPIEFIMLAVNLALRRDTYHIGYFTEGNVPEALVGAPEEWTQPQVETWQKYWDAMVAGNISGQRKMHFVPLRGSSGGIPVYEFRKDDVNMTAQDEWLMKVACWAFGNSPAEFGLTNSGLGGAGFTEGQENIQYRSMIRPITQYVARLLTNIIQTRYSRADLAFQWVGLEAQEDKLQQAQIDQIYINAKVYDPAYVRRREGIAEDEVEFEDPEPEAEEKENPIPDSNEAMEMDDEEMEMDDEMEPGVAEEGDASKFFWKGYYG